MDWTRPVDTVDVIAKCPALAPLAGWRWEWNPASPLCGQAPGFDVFLHVWPRHDRAELLVWRGPARGFELTCGSIAEMVENAAVDRRTDV